MVYKVKGGGLVITMSSHRYFLGILLILFLWRGTGICQAQQASQKPSISTISISPDGLRMAIVEKTGEKERIIISSTPQLNGKEVSAFNKGLIGSPRWCYDGKHLLFLHDRTKNGNGHIWCTNLNSGSTRDLTPEVTTTASLLALSPKVPNEALILIQNSNYSSDVYRLNLEKGTCSIDSRNDGTVTTWLSDRMLCVRGAIKDDGKGCSTLEVRDTPSSPWHQLMKWKRHNTAGESAAFSHDGKKIFVAAPGTNGSQSVLLIDCATKKRIELFDGKGEIISGITLTTDGNALEAVSLLKRAHTTWKAVDSKMVPFYEKLRKLYQADTFYIQSRSIDNTLWIVEYLHEDGQYRTYLFDCRNSKAALLVDGESR